MSRFTQRELEQAWEQMQIERNNEANQARLAAHWVAERLKAEEPIRLKDASCNYTQPRDRGMPFGAPYPVNYVLLVAHDYYGPSIKTYTDVFDKVSWAIDAKPIQGFPDNLPKYVVTTPYGQHRLTFEFTGIPSW
jgi:hypothetical protein